MSLTARYVIQLEHARVICLPVMERKQGLHVKSQESPRPHSQLG